ncbi:DUF4190 domain-containing protein [Streptomyces somaliensis DSM 40738]|uniref:DUF4190 domain-containing protein n=1 Tax=Streptomyces somaliensis (strain ATCC 33201 / DSM 40738 / JCM 12659 / KCTC 9044 / NCTC 11332 / NRRL B-12077 / IP 733) TaxID=1134445 RepID=A0AA44DFA6_STRE0|nr:DUF4190 domain-containing protein [Streptomyces somaliensis]MCQ0023465.1 DUF4190 domain-containing protein [Streptomyces somaliensis DSM 40738]NKY15838.1 DUF4190 domain-containing protein [Streptomyces somaliensis DSM 40738]
MSDPYQQPGGFGPGPYGNGHPSQPGYGYPAPAAPTPPPVGYPTAPPPPYAAPAPAYGMPAAQPSNGLGTAGLVLGIIGIVCNLTVALWLVGVVLGILAIIFGAIGRGKANRGEATNRGAAMAGLVTGIISAVLIPSILLLLFASAVGMASSGS